MRIRRKFAAALAATALVAGLGTVAAPTANAAAGCWYQNGRWWCINVYAAPVYGYVGNNHIYPDPSRIVGRMYTTTSWFYCRIDGQAWVGGPHPTRWELTVADNGALGYMKDTSIYSETDPLPGPC